MIRSVCSAFVNAPLFRKRSAEAKLLWYTLYLHPAQHLCGLFVLDLAHMALDTGLPVERTREALAELVKFGLCQVDSAQDLVWLPEMTEQARGMVKARGTVYKGVEKYIASLGNHTLCHRVSHTLIIGSADPSDTTLLDSVSGTGSDSEDPPLPPQSGGAPEKSSHPTEAKTQEPPQSPVLPGIPDQPNGPEKPPKSNRKRDRDKAAWDAQTLLATTLLNELSVAIRSVRPGARMIRQLDSTRQYIQARLVDGYTVDDVRHVIEIYKAESRHNPKTLNCFNHQTPFLPDNFARNLPRTIEDAGKPTGFQANPTPRYGPPPPEECDRVNRERRERDEAKMAELQAKADALRRQAARPGTDEDRAAIEAMLAETKEEDGHDVDD